MLQPSFQCSVPPATTEGVSSSSTENPKARAAVFSADSSDPFPFRAFLVTEIFSGLRLAYPAGKGSAAILPSMASKSRRIISASSSR